MRNLVQMSIKGGVFCVFLMVYPPTFLCTLKFEAKLVYKYISKAN